MADSAPLTAETLQAAIAKVRDSRPAPCEHVVHPKAEGWTRCRQWSKEAGLMYRVEERRKSYHTKTGALVEFKWRTVGYHQSLDKAELVAKLINKGEMSFEARVVPVLVKVG